jgi:hypothetical protein
MKTDLPDTDKSGVKEQAMRWENFAKEFEKKFAKKLTLETLYFMIGLEERYTGEAMDKTVKEEVISEGVRKILAAKNFYVKTSDGVWQETRPLPVMTEEEKEQFFRIAALDYLGK